MELPYGAINSKKAIDTLIRLQRMIAIRVISGYRTVSADAALVLARIPPAHIYAAYSRRVFLRINDLKRSDEWNPLIDKEIKRDEGILLLRQWKMYIQRHNAAGRRTCDAIPPVLDEWLARKHGELTFHTTQLLTGHGCMATYLYRIGKDDSPICRFCEDSPEHVLQAYEEWKDQRELLCSVIGEDLALSNVIRQILTSQDNWEAFTTFANEVMLIKEEEERARERLGDDDSPS